VAATGATRSSGFPRLALQGDRLVLAWVEEGEPGRLRAAELQHVQPLSFRRATGHNSVEMRRAAR
jgi:hypothetical protein